LCFSTASNANADPRYLRPRDRNPFVALSYCFFLQQFQQQQPVSELETLNPKLETLSELDLEAAQTYVSLKVEYVRVAYQNKKKTSFARARRSTRAS
jgi:hypothetical protein